MATKTAVKKKVVAKKVAAKTTVKKAAAKAPRVTSAAPVGGEIFKTSGADARAIEVPPGRVALYVNGSSQGNQLTEGETIGSFTQKWAQDKGIRTYSVYVDGRKVDATEAGARLTNAVKVEIVAKDARGDAGK